MKQYQLLNNILGWLVFAVASVTYFMTVEPTASFWDCPEFITCAAKGEVGHPPGNTFFNLTGRFFVNFAGGDMTQAGLWVNRMSALFSAGTILFLFWTITALTRKIVCRTEETMSKTQMIAILGSGLVGSLVYTWSDTFWFSATEGEVYAFSSFMTALVFWLILKWERHASGVAGDRYIILISYIIGLSIGVHLLNLLCIPAIVLVYYFKKTPNAKLKGALGALLLSMLMIAFILYGMVPGLVKLASLTELLFVNTFGMSYNSGTCFYFLLVLAVLVWGIWMLYRPTITDRMMRIVLSLGLVITGLPFVGDQWWLGMLVAAALVIMIFAYRKLNARFASNILFCLLTILVGYSTFAQIIIRSSAQLPMNQNNPDEIFSFAKYLNREQYGESPLFFGQTFASDVLRDRDGSVKVKEGAPIYAKVVKSDPSEPDRYYVAGHRETYEYNYTVFFPRMYSKMGNHVSGYKEWSDFEGKRVRVDGKTIVVPTFAENMRYFFRYQLNFMYWRYFMWNFSGRQSDEQSVGEVDRGNWITGIPFIDEILVGSQENMPRSITENRGHNVYYMLPLLLGLLGLFFQAYRGQQGIQGFWVVFFLFFMTGIAIVLYLNQTPYQPRERDYAYAASFYAFSIWVGMGVAALVSWIGKLLRKDNAVVAAALSLLCLFVPFQMMGQNWDDHDRSNRYTARDFGRNYLTSVEENAIIFTNGDNDTFPLWYAQDVEGYRTDVRVCNLSYLQTDWYINQMKSQAYESEPLPIGIEPRLYAQDKLNYAHIFPIANGEQPLSSVMNYLSSDDPKYKHLPQYGRLDYIPTSKMYIDIDRDAVLSSPVIDVPDTALISDRMHIDLGEKSYITKNEIAVLAMLDGISRDGWKRPIYFATTVGPDMHLGLQRYFRLVGLAYQIMPLEQGGTNSVDIDKTYDNMINKFEWGNIQDTTIYLDENNRRMCRTQRMMFTNLIDQLLANRDNERALAATDFCVKTIPGATVPHEYTSLTLSQTYYVCGKPEQGNAILTAILADADDYLQWATSLKSHHIGSVANQIHRQLVTMRDALQQAERFGQQAIVDQYDANFTRYFEVARSKRVL